MTSAVEGSDQGPSDGQTRDRAAEYWLLAGTFVIAVASLVYELIAATVSSYLLGDSVLQFSLVIGVFLSSMGVGAWLSRYVVAAERAFTLSQITLGCLGGVSAIALFFSYAFLGHVYGVLFFLLIAIGALAGMEIPLITRILQARDAGPHTLPNVLTADYIGALAASLLFPLLIVPQLGLMAAGLVFGGLNLAVALISLWLFRDILPRFLWFVWGLASVLTIVGLTQTDRLTGVVDTALYEDEVVLTARSPYQQITLTRYRDRLRLFLDASIQFDSRDEYRYHEALVHPAMSLATHHKDVLVLGGGDGLAVREVLKYEGVEAVTLVDLDPMVTELFKTNPDLIALNGDALNDPRTRVVNKDAWRYVEEEAGQYDVIILDLPDPDTFSISKLYSREFYGVLVQHLNLGGVIVSQATSPVFAREAFWSVHNTLAAAPNPYADQPLTTIPYHVYVPSFGDWGFVIAGAQNLSQRELSTEVEHKFLTAERWQAAQVFGRDIDRVPADQNSIQTHAVVNYYLEGWGRWFN